MDSNKGDDEVDSQDSSESGEDYQEEKQYSGKDVDQLGSESEDGGSVEEDAHPDTHSQQAGDDDVSSANDGSYRSDGSQSGDSKVNSDSEEDLDGEQSEQESVKSRASIYGQRKLSAHSRKRVGCKRLISHGFTRKRNKRVRSSTVDNEVVKALYSIINLIRMFTTKKPFGPLASYRLKHEFFSKLEEHFLGREQMKAALSEDELFLVDAVNSTENWEYISQLLNDDIDLTKGIFQHVCKTQSE